MGPDPIAMSGGLDEGWRDIAVPEGNLGVYLVGPTGQGPRPLIIMLQEIFGVNKAMKVKARRFAQAGYRVALPDLFWRQTARLDLGYSPEDRTRAFGMMQAFDLNQGVSDLVNMVEPLKAITGSTGPASVIGFCLGGKVAVHLGSRIEAAAIISFYGVRLEQDLDLFATIDCPLQIHVGDQDEHVPVATTRLLQEAVTSKPDAEVFLYPGAGHGFFNPLREGVFDDRAAEEAFQRVLSVLPEPGA
ncbi:MAG: dienelactone hydrolase family protein [Brevundimonas sp.]|uniref:dienelactone hydrolase family protein n=1 Tax=Brevundimonas sp. TaxID=1871086 RepID=UPI000DBBD004|nr:dienelactone hydrolase family protein [Brevundimonas sp.]PZU60437.1 MAG: dienelactone hydrolase family protein [Brevundimonas sp.]